MSGRVLCLVLLLVLIIGGSVCGAEYRIAIPGAVGSYQVLGDGSSVLYDFGRSFTHISNVRIHLVGSVTPGVGVWESPPGLPYDDEQPISGSDEFGGMFSATVSSISGGAENDFGSVTEGYTGSFDVVRAFTMPLIPGETPEETLERHPDRFDGLRSGQGYLGIRMLPSPDPSFISGFEWQSLPSAQLSSVELIVDGTVPEPGSVAVLLCGLVGLGGITRRVRR